VLFRPRHDVAIVATAHRRRKTFLDNNDTIQAVTRKISHPEATGIQEFLNPELTVKKLGSGLQRVSEGIVCLRACVHFSPKSSPPNGGVCGNPITPKEMDYFAATKPIVT
jgi:hypothetical protein